jgi:hypothetical protein
MHREAFLFYIGKRQMANVKTVVSPIQLKAKSSKPKANTGCKQYTTAWLPRRGLLPFAFCLLPINVVEAIN